VQGIQDNLGEYFNFTPGVFLYIYILTFIPSWIALILSLRYLKRRNIHASLFWLIILFGLLALPYLYVLVGSVGLPWQFLSAIILIPTYSFSKILMNRKTYSDTFGGSFFWTLYAKVYDLLLLFSPYKQLVSQLLEEIRVTKPAGNIIDIGCGTGNLAVSLSANTNYTILGIDNSIGMLTRAQKKHYDKQRVLFQKVDLENENFISEIDGKFDIAIISNVLYTLGSPIMVLKQIKALLNNDGFLIISEPKQGSSLYALFKEHYRQLFSHFSINNLIISVRDFFILLVVGVFNFAISFRARGRGSYSFFLPHNLTQLVQESGFSIEKIGASYANQNILLKAKKILT
jgi:SAM-dependent methyltransferase